MTISHILSGEEPPKSTGALAGEPRTALLRLWAPRTTDAVAEGPVGLLSQACIDDKEPGASGHPFGSLSAITAEGRDVSTAVTDPLTVTLTFKPFEDGVEGRQRAPVRHDGVDSHPAINVPGELLKDYERKESQSIPMADRGTPPFERSDSTFRLAEQSGVGTQPEQDGVAGTLIAKARFDFRKAWNTTV